MDRTSSRPSAATEPSTAAARGPTTTHRAPTRLLLIANPISGGGRSRHLAPQLAAALAHHGIVGEVHFTRDADDARRRAAAAHGEGWDGLVVVGGDGTVNEVLNGMSEPSLPLGMLPVGTANVLATEYHLPRTVAAAAALLARGNTTELPVAHCADRRFLLFAGAGLDGDIVHRVAARRSGTLGKHKYLVPILQALWQWQLPHLRLTLADGEVLDDVSSVLVTCVRNYGGALRLPGEFSFDRRHLHVLAFRGRSRCSFLRHGWRGLWGRMRADRSLSLRTTTSVRIEGAAPLQVDGDARGSTPTSIELLPSRAKLFVP